MTREERLDWLCRLRSGLVWFDIPSKERLMLEEALSDEINDLQQEPCEDCISRQAVLDMVEDMTDQFGNKHRVITEGMISLLPPVTPKPKTDVLDKIRAEIEQEYNRLSATRDETLDLGECLGLKMSLKIIDNYKAESEDKE